MSDPVIELITSPDLIVELVIVQDGGSSDQPAVLYTPQTLFASQKAQARNNIEAPDAADLAAEIEAREHADTALQEDINAEAIARKQADTALQNDIAYTNVSITELSGNGVITVPEGLYIKDVNIFVKTGDPTVEVVELQTGQMQGQDIYPIAANWKSTGALTVNVSGGTVIIQIIKFNI